MAREKCIGIFQSGHYAFCVSTIQGTWRNALSGSHWRRYLVAALLGATPGCLGAFVIGTLFIHRAVSLRAVEACMIATSGDEAFVMFVTFPRTAILLSVGLTGIGVATGLFTDMASGPPAVNVSCSAMVVHGDDDQCRCFEAGSVLSQLKHLTLIRGILIGGIGLFLVGNAAGTIGPSGWGWIRVSLLMVGTLTLFVVATAPDHFVDKHLWRHVVLGHIPRIFLWVLEVLTVISVLQRFSDIGSFVRGNSWPVLTSIFIKRSTPTRSRPRILNQRLK